MTKLTMKYIANLLFGEKDRDSIVGMSGEPSAKFCEMF